MEDGHQVKACQIFWAKKGAENVEQILRDCIDLDNKHVTSYAFSTEELEQTSI